MQREIVDISRRAADEFTGRESEYRSRDSRAHHPGRRTQADSGSPRYLLSMKLPAGDKERVNRFSAKARAGSLTGTEAQELDSYLHIGFLLGVMQSRAPRLPKNGKLSRLRRKP